VTGFAAYSEVPGNAVRAQPGAVDERDDEKLKRETLPILADSSEPSQPQCVSSVTVPRGMLI